MDRKSFLLVIVLILKECLTALVNQEEEDKCADYAKDVFYHHPTFSYTSPNPTGVWTSTKCEIVPNTKFIMRRLHIERTKWTSYIYHYSESWCTTPTFHVKIEGNYELLSATATPNSKASYASVFRFTNIYFYSESTIVLENVINFILKKCANALPSIASMSKDNRLYLDNYVNKYIDLNVNGVINKKHCRYYFALHPNSYRKIHMTGENSGIPSKTTENDILYFASISSFQSSNKQTHISAEFQYGLSRLNRPRCKVCAMVSQLKRPEKAPKLVVPKGRRNFGGGWVTETCEATDDTTFQSKYYKFTYKDNKSNVGSFIVHENLFSDSNCKDKKFNIKVGGEFTNVLSKRGLRGIYRVTLHFKWLTLTIYDSAILSLVRNGDCGDSTKWQLGSEQNVTGSHGCPLLGYPIPVTANFLIRVSKTLNEQKLYAKQVEEKGTFFTSNFVSCKTVTQNFKKRVTTTLPAPKKNVVPTEKNFVLKKNKFDNTNSAGLSRHSQSTCLNLLFSILYIFYYFV